MSSKTFPLFVLALVLSCGLSNRAFAFCDDDDDYAGRYFSGEFELTQESVFGTLDGVRAWNEANGTITDSQIQGGNSECQGDGLDTNHNANVTIVNSQITGLDDGIKAKLNSRVIVNSGTIMGNDDGISAAGNALVRINGGTVNGDIHGISAIDQSVVQVAGGEVLGGSMINDNGRLDLFGGQVQSIRVNDNGLVNIVGGQIDGVAEATGNGRVQLFTQPGQPSMLWDGTAINEFEEGHYYDTYTSDIVTSQNTVLNYGLLDIGDSPPTLTMGPNGQAYSVYLGGASSANLDQGRIYGELIADDQSQVVIDGSLLQGFRAAVTAYRSSQITLQSGNIDNTNVGVLALGDSRLDVRGGAITTLVDGVQAEDDSVVSVTGGVIVGRDDEGMRLRDRASLMLTGGSIQGGQNGVSASEYSTVQMMDGRVSGPDNAIRMRDNSQLLIQGGEVGGRILLEDQAIGVIQGGTVSRNLIARNESRMEFSGGRFGGAIQAEDDSQAVISNGQFQAGLRFSGNAIGSVHGGEISGPVMALDQSLVRIIGRGLARNDNVLSGQLLDGHPLQNVVFQDTDAKIILYEGLDRRRTYDLPFPKNTNMAVLGTAGPEEAIDLRSGSQVQGELLVGEDGRVNMMGGAVDGEITILNGGRIAFYGTDIRTPSAVPENGFYQYRINGTNLDGNRFNMEIMKEIGSADVLVFNAIRQGMTLTDVSSNIAVMDGPNGPVRVEVRGLLYGTNEVWGSSELVIRSETNQNYFRELVAWEQGSLEIHGGAISGQEAVTAFDLSQVRVFGGELSGFRDGMRIWHNSSLEMSGGLVTGQDDGIDVDNSGSVWITGGRISGANDGLKVKGYSSTTLASGVITGQDDGISVADDAVVRIAGSDTLVFGAVGVKAIDRGLAEVYGGQISGRVWAVLAEDDSQINLFGGDIQGTVATFGGTINIVGADLTLSDDGRLVTGLALDGSPLSIPIHADGEGAINLIATYYGDANLDGEFNSLDFVSAFVGVEYEDSVIRNSTWADGDWNGDGEFDSSDMVLAFQFGGYEQGPRAATSIRTVPEPPSLALLSVGLLVLFCRTMRKSRR